MATCKPTLTFGPIGRCGCSSLWSSLCAKHLIRDPVEASVFPGTWESVTSQSCSVRGLGCLSWQLWRGIVKTVANLWDFLVSHLTFDSGDTDLAPAGLLQSVLWLKFRDSVSPKIIPS